MFLYLDSEPNCTFDCDSLIVSTDDKVLLYNLWFEFSSRSGLPRLRADRVVIPIPHPFYNEENLPDDMGMTRVFASLSLKDCFCAKVQEHFRSQGSLANGTELGVIRRTDGMVTHLMV